MKGRSDWAPRHTEPVRNGVYQCLVMVCRGMYTYWMLEWDGKGFIVPFPMRVLKWRGLTKAAYDKEVLK